MAVGGPGEWRADGARVEDLCALEPDDRLALILLLLLFVVALRLLLGAANRLFYAVGGGSYGSVMEKFKFKTP